MIYIAHRSKGFPVGEQWQNIMGRKMAAKILKCLLIAAILPTVSPATSYGILIPVKQKGSGPLYRIERQGKWGYVNRQGRVVVSPRFDEASDFFCGLAKVRVGDLWGYTSESGKLEIPAQFDSAADFKDDRAAVGVNALVGVIDTSGHFIVNPQFGEIKPYFGSRAAVWANSKRKRST
ncbi:MAG: Leptospira repeat protein, partial [Bryobacterales bacterium]|nr:Leptospira repeat protein [Bryobacterales bacterium]